MRALGIVKLEVTPDLASGFAHRLVGVQVDVFVFERTPQPLDENVVSPPAFAIHTDLDALFFEPSGEGFTGELTSLIGVEDLRRALLMESLFSASIQNPVSIVMDNRQASTRRLNQSTTAAR